MIAITLAAALLAAPQATDDMTRDVLTNVCLPYVTGQSTDTAAAEALGFLVVERDEEGVQMQTEDQGFSLRIATTGTMEDETLDRLCVLQARRGSLGDLRSGVRRQMSEGGFVPDAGQPAERPVWTKDGITVSLRQNEGRAAIMRVIWNVADAQGS